ncbi:MAG: signal peptide peptidase SppA [Vicinamibacteria bacterium]
MPRRLASVVRIDLTHDVEEGPSGPALFRTESVTLYDLVEAIRRASSDRGISGLFLKVDVPDLGWSKAESLHRAVRRFVATGKPAVAFLSRCGNSSYLAGAAAGMVALDPSSTLDLQALSSDGFFLKDLLGGLGVDPELDHIGEFKSSGEMFERRQASDAHRLQIDEILSDLHQQIVSCISLSRGISLEAVTESIFQGPLLPEEALEKNLVDAIAESDRAEEIFEEKLGCRVRFLPHRRYLGKGRLRRRLWGWRRPRVALVHASGVITTGDARRWYAGPRAIGARELTELFATLRANRRVKAVVVRVESPGGGAAASDRIRRAILATARDKPVVVSMGDIAASGGYYIATAANAVVAEGLTLTGSIGVIGGKLVLRRLLDRLGIHHESRSTGPNAGFFSPFRAFRPEERARHGQFLRHFYETKFLPAVAEGRSLALEQADAVGRGRVWTGRQARERGLVDVLGGLDDAIDRACQSASLDRARARVVVYAPRRKFRDLLLSGRVSSPMEYLGGALSLFEELAREELLLLTPRFFRIR